MHSYVETILIVIILSDMLLLGVSLLNSCVNLVAIQGIVLCLSTFFLQQHSVTMRLIVIAIASVVIKGFVFPYLIKKSMKDSGVRRELEPVIGNIFSIFIGIALFVFSLVFWLSAFIFKIFNIDVWAERSGVYTFQSLFLGVVVLLVESIWLRNSKR